MTAPTGGSPMSPHEILRASDLFRDLPDETLDELLPFLHEREVEAGTALVRQGEAGTEMFLVGSGTLEARVSDRGTMRRLGALGPGDVFGEMAVLRSAPRMATVVAMTPARVWVLPAAALNEATANNPTLAARLRALMKRRDVANAMRRLQ